MYKILHIPTGKILSPMRDGNNIVIIFEDLFKFTDGWTLLSLESREEAGYFMYKILNNEITTIYSEYNGESNWKCFLDAIIKEELEVIKI